MDRILFNHPNDVDKYGKVDEIVVEDCMFHIEQMDKGNWYIGVYKKDGSLLQLWLNEGTLEYDTDIKWGKKETHDE